MRKIKDLGRHYYYYYGEILTSNQTKEDLSIKSPTTEVKVVMVTPSGHVETLSSFQNKRKSMIMNLHLYEEMNCGEFGLHAPLYVRKTCSFFEKNCGQGISRILQIWFHFLIK